jgi:hypothetical protein
LGGAWYYNNKYWCYWYQKLTKDIYTSTLHSILCVDKYRYLYLV